jgi:hypothetical protein
VRWFRFGAWVAAVILIVRAVSRPAERKAIACGLVTAASYLAIVAFHEQPFRLPTTSLLEMMRPEFETVQVRRAGGTMSRVHHNANAEEFRTIGEYSFATVFGVMAALLAVY